MLHGSHHPELWRDQVGVLHSSVKGQNSVGPPAQQHGFQRGVGIELQNEGVEWRDEGKKSRETLKSEEPAIECWSEGDFWCFVFFNSQRNVTSLGSSPWEKIAPCAQAQLQYRISRLRGRLLSPRLQMWHYSVSQLMHTKPHLTTRVCTVKESRSEALHLRSGPERTVCHYTAE